jgi:hypothetical protein
VPVPVNKKKERKRNNNNNKKLMLEPASFKDTAWNERFIPMMPQLFLLIWLYKK